MFSTKIPSKGIKKKNSRHQTSGNKFNRKRHGELNSNVFFKKTFVIICRSLHR